MFEDREPEVGARFITRVDEGADFRFPVDKSFSSGRGRRPTDQRRFNTSQIMKKELDWQNLDIIRLFLLHREADFEEHIEEYGFSPSEAEDYREEVMQLLWDKMEEVL